MGLSGQAVPQLSDGIVLIDGHLLSDIDVQLAGEDEEHARRFGWYPACSTRESVRHAIERWQDEWRTGGRTRAFAIRSALSGELLGGCELRLQGNGVAHISYWTFPPHRGQGYATRAVRLACRYAFADLGVKRIEAHTELDNWASRRVALKAGFTEGGRVLGIGEARELLRYVLGATADLEKTLPGEWQPLAPHEAAALFAGAEFPWWVAGGWAIDLFLGHQTRTHHDLDVGVLRRDQLAVHAFLARWELWAAYPPGQLRKWEAGESLPVEVHDVWCREAAGDPWRFQLMLNESSGDHWVYRRDPSVTRPLTQVILATEDGIPYLAPEVQLLFKATHPRAKDDADLASALRVLSRESRDWLVMHARLTVYD